jgi:hypothetical protein
MPKLAGRDYPLSATPELSAVSSSPSFLGLGNKEKRMEKKADREFKRANRGGGGGGRCTKRRGCPGQGSGLGFSGYN